jgi:hypothetical protein
MPAHHGRPGRTARPASRATSRPDGPWVRLSGSTRLWPSGPGLLVWLMGDDELREGVHRTRLDRRVGQPGGGSGRTRPTS